MSDMQQMGRLAMRVEGDDWVAYYAQLGTMDGALRLGSIRMALVQDKARKEAFMGIFRAWLTDELGKRMGKDVAAEIKWGFNAAPESERSGSA